MAYLVTNSNIYFTKGHTRSLLMDPFRNHIEFVPNTLVDFINAFSGKNVDDNNLPEGGFSEEIGSEYLEFLISNEYCFLVQSVDQVRQFKEKESHYDEPHLITNSILQISSNLIISDLIKIINELEELDCRFIEIFILERLDEIKELFAAFKDHKFDNIHFYYNGLSLSNHSIHNFIESIRVFKKEAANIKEVVFSIYGIHLEPHEWKFDYLFIKILPQKMVENINCGAIRKHLFTLHNENIRESMFHNSCLSRKISVDAEGNIKNCPSMNETFGNIKDTTLNEAIEKPCFKKYWDINKEKIHVCKDCEFRFICTDCRAYVEDPEDILSKPLKCGYNPYTGEWSEWSTSPLKQKAINYYKMSKLVNKNESLYLL